MLPHARCGRRANFPLTYTLLCAVMYTELNCANYVRGEGLSILTHYINGLLMFLGVRALTAYHAMTDREVQTQILRGFR